MTSWFSLSLFTSFTLKIRVPTANCCFCSEIVRLDLSGTGSVLYTFKIFTKRSIRVATVLAVFTFDKFGCTPSLPIPKECIWLLSLRAAISYLLNLSASTPFCTAHTLFHTQLESHILCCIIRFTMWSVILYRSSSITKLSLAHFSFSILSCVLDYISTAGARFNIAWLL